MHWNYDCDMLAYLHVSMSYTKQLLKSTVYLRDNSVRGVIVVQGMHRQTDQQKDAENVKQS